MRTSPLSVVMLGATGAVGEQTVKKLLTIPAIEHLSLLGRRPLSDLPDPKSIVHQHQIDIFDTSTYQHLLPGHHIAICTLGVGQPSKTSKADFIKIDKLAVLDFATACKKAGIRHFELLASVGINANSSSFYLRTKGELVEELTALQFERLSIFQPSMILTPNNRYGLLQGLTLFIWPLLHPLLLGSLRQYRGIPVDVLGKAMAINILGNKTGVERLSWDDFWRLAERKE
ncbi:MAG: NAD(P)H-binding protein [Saprospiraceae bacterium]